MTKGLFADSSPFVQLIMLTFCMIMCVFLFTLIGLLFAPLVLGIPFDELMDIRRSGLDLQNLKLMQYMQVLQDLGFFIIPAFIAAYLFSRKTASFFELNKTASSKWFGMVLLAMLAALPCINLLATLNEMIVFPKSLSGLEQHLRDFEDTARQLVELFLKVDHTGGLLFNIFLMALLPALGEELIFRGVIQKILFRWAGNIHVAIIVTGFLFSLMHMQFYGFFPRWLLGVMFGYMLVWSGTIWLPIFAHFVNNAAVVIVSFLIHKGIISETIEEFGSSSSDLPVTILALAICVWLFWKMYKNRNIVIHNS
jgi:membrane protease YdiL (CAAX protease family)